MIAEKDWIWLAGYIESKKGLSRHQTNGRIYPTLDLTSKDSGLLEWISMTFDLPQPMYLPTMNSYRIAIRSRDDLLRVVQSILPYVKSSLRQDFRDVLDKTIISINVR